MLLQVALTPRVGRRLTGMSHEIVATEGEQRRRLSERQYLPPEIGRSLVCVPECVDIRKPRARKLPVLSQPVQLTGSMDELSTH